jgi:hypothetical protein
VRKDAPDRRGSGGISDSRSRRRSPDGGEQREPTAARSEQREVRASVSDDSKSRAHARVLDRSKHGWLPTTSSLHTWRDFVDSLPDLGGKAGGFDSVPVGQFGRFALSF